MAQRTKVPVCISLEFSVVPESLSNIDKEIVAFANSSGGRIFFGVGDDNEVKGIRITNELKSQIQDRANNCQPPVTVLLEEFGNILIITVMEGVDKPCKCSAGFYARVGPNSQKLDRDSIIEFFKSEGKIRFDELVNLRFDYADSDGFCGFQSLRPCVIASLRSSDITQGRKVERDAPAFFAYARELPLATTENVRTSNFSLLSRYVFSRSASSSSSGDY